MTRALVIIAIIAAVVIGILLIMKAARSFVGNDTSSRRAVRLREFNRAVALRNEANRLVLEISTTIAAYSDIDSPLAAVLRPKVTEYIQKSLEDK